MSATRKRSPGPKSAPAADDDPIARRRAELALEAEHLDLHDAYVKAKETLPRDSAEFLKAKAAFTEHRTYWRQIRELFSPPITEEG